jgi:hypothetical protein
MASKASTGTVEVFAALEAAAGRNRSSSFPVSFGSGRRQAQFAQIAVGAGGFDDCKRCCAFSWVNFVEDISQCRAALIQVNHDFDSVADNWIQTWWLCLMNFATDNLVFDPQIIRRFDVNGPRYTSYPTADRFVEAFRLRSGQALARQTQHRRHQPTALIILPHPFCNTICYYCACNKIITKDHGRSAKYLKYLAKELACRAASLKVAMASTK